MSHFLSPLPGQVWQDWDTRRRSWATTTDMQRARAGEPVGARLLEVLSVSADGTRVRVRNIASGRRTSVSARRMRPSSNGYRLVHDVLASFRA